MKIGILTFHRSYNYGAFMQCFSLSKRLQKDFPECNVEVIDYTVQRVINSYKDAVSKNKNLEIRHKLEERNKAFLAVQSTLPLSKYSEFSDDYANAVKYMNENYDAVVVGSDAVWNWISRGFPNLYFLKDYKGIKLSYAASAHGMNYQNMTEEQRKYLSEALSCFDYIGVRDVTTEKMVKYINSSLTPVHNCDPTTFLNLDDVPCNMEMLKKKLQMKGVDFSKPLIGLMASNVIGREIKKRWKGKVQIIALYEPNKYADVFLNDLTPFEWAKVFAFFKVTVTHYFHGTMLSLVNGIPVIPIEFLNDFSDKNKTKINDLMERLDLLEWRYTEDYRSQGLIKKVMRKTGLWENKKLWNRVNELIESFLISDYKDKIQNKLNFESSTYSTFYNVLKALEKGK